MFIAGGDSCLPFFVILMTACSEEHKENLSLHQWHNNHPNQNHLHFTV
jgi:hypothetical protein